MTHLPIGNEEWRFVHGGNCPRCGAPIYAKMRPVYEGTEEQRTALPATGRIVDAPVAHFTCDCRVRMPL